MKKTLLFLAKGFQTMEASVFIDVLGWALNDYQLPLGNDGLLGIVGTNVAYAPHVEFGTVRQSAQPFLRPALGAAS